MGKELSFAGEGVGAAIRTSTGGWGFGPTDAAEIGGV